MDSDEQNQSISKGTLPVKLRMKERSRSQTTTNTDINDPENLDYEEEDAKTDDNHSVEPRNDPVKKVKSSIDIQDEEGEVSNNLPNPVTASDEGEIDEADLEDGEIHDPSSSKNKSSTSDEQLSEQHSNRTNTGVPSSPQAKVHCRFFLQGRCHWGPNCKYIHPNNDSNKNPNGTSNDGLPSVNHEISPPVTAAIPLSQTTNNSWISPQAITATSQFFPNPLIRGQVPSTGIPLVPPSGTESAWERGLRSAKTLREQSIRRKQQDKDFNDKKFNLTIRDALDEKDSDDNILNIDRPSPIDYDLNNLPGSTYADQRGYSDRYHSYMYSGSTAHPHYNNHHRMNNNPRHTNSSSTNDHPDRRSRHSDDYSDVRNENRNRKEKPPTKDSKTTSKRDDSSSYKRNSSQQQYTSGSHHNNNEQLHLNPYNNRRGDDWHDPWDRSRNHGGTTRRPSGGGREPSYSSSSATSSSSSRSSRSHSPSSTSSSRSRSRSRSRPKRRSPSVTRATKPAPTTKSSETVKNGNEKKSNGNKKLVSPSITTATANKFLPGRQISSHTLKKAEKSSISSNSTNNNHSKDQRGKDSDINIKKPTKKENISRLNSTSSSSSSDSDTNRKTHRSSSSSSDSSSSENETRAAAKTKTASAGSKTSASSHSTKPVSRQVSSSSGAGGKSTETKSKTESSTRPSSKNKESSATTAKKRRDTSSSTGSTSTAKKAKLNTDSHKSSTDPSNAENSDSSKKKEKQKILKQLQEVEKLISQRSTKASS